MLPLDGQEDGHRIWELLWGYSPLSHCAYHYIDGPTPSRRAFFEKALATGAAAVVAANPAVANAYELPDLPYPFEALEPYIDTPTMKYVFPLLSL